MDCLRLFKITCAISLSGCAVLAHAETYLVTEQSAQECWTEQVGTGGINAGAALLGGIAGGILGSQAGGGTGQAVATAAGAIVGAIVGESLDTQSSTQVVRRCRPVLQSSRPSVDYYSYDYGNVYGAPPVYVYSQPAYQYPRSVYSNVPPGYYYPQPAYSYPQPAYSYPRTVYAYPQPAYAYPQPSVIYGAPAGTRYYLPPASPNQYRRY